MLANLLKNGFSATAFDIVPAALDRAVGLGSDANLVAVARALASS